MRDNAAVALARGVVGLHAGMEPGDVRAALDAAIAALPLRDDPADNAEAGHAPPRPAARGALRRAKLSGRRAGAADPRGLGGVGRRTAGSRALPPAPPPAPLRHPRLPRRRVSAPARSLPRARGSSRARGAAGRVVDAESRASARRILEAVAAAGAAEEAGAEADAQLSLAGAVQ